MPTQSIDFGNVGAANFNGTSLTGINLNGSGIWTGAYSDYIGGMLYRNTPKNKPKISKFSYQLNHEQLRPAANWLPNTMYHSTNLHYNGHFKGHWFLHKMEMEYNPRYSTNTKLKISIGYNNTHNPIGGYSYGDYVEALMQNYQSGAIPPPFNQFKLIKSTLPGGSLTLDWPVAINDYRWDEAAGSVYPYNGFHNVGGLTGESFWDESGTVLHNPTTARSYFNIEAEWRFPQSYINPSHFGGYEVTPSRTEYLTYELS